MKLKKYVYFYSTLLGNYTLKIMKKYLEFYFKKPGKIMEISWNFFSSEKWEPCYRLQRSDSIHEEGGCLPDHPPLADTSP